MLPEVSQDSIKDEGIMNIQTFFNDSVEFGSFRDTVGLIGKITKFKEEVVKPFKPFG
jgi:hypothetical protein